MQLCFPFGFINEAKKKLECRHACQLYTFFSNTLRSLMTYFLKKKLPCSLMSSLLLSSAHKQQQQQQQTATMVRPNDDTLRSYKNKMCDFMKWLHNTEEYTPQTEYARDDLLAIRPVHIVRFLNKKAYGDEDPPRDARPMEARKETLDYYKKSISFFMPRKKTRWHEDTEYGNPTQSDAVNELISEVEGFETHGEGRDSTARREFEESELRRLLNLFRVTPLGGLVTAFGLPAQFVMQVQMMARLDDTCMFQKQYLDQHNVWGDYALRFRMLWSKTVKKRKQAPWQIMFASADPLFCVFINMAIWLEYKLTCSIDLSPYIFNFLTDVWAA